MKKYIAIVAAVMTTVAASAQTPLQSLLETVELNNPQLKAKRELANAQTIGARVGNSLENPTVEYERMWGNRSELGKTGEFTVRQAFDLPMVYIYKNNAAKARAEQFGNEYADFRQELLLSAQSTYITAVALQEQINLNSQRLAQLQEMATAIEKRFNAGDATIIEKNRAEIEIANSINALELLRIELHSALTTLSNLSGGAEVNVNGVSLEKLAVGCDELPDMATMRAMYEQKSPRLLTAISQLNAAKMDTKASRSESLPKLELGYKRAISPGERFNGVVMGVSIPMFGNRNNVKRAKAEQHYAEVSLQSEKLNVQTLLDELYGKLDVLRNAIKRYNGAGKVAGNSAEILDKALNSGSISIQDYISELGVVTATEETITNLMRDYIIVCAQIRAVEL